MKTKFNIVLSVLVLLSLFSSIGNTETISNPESTASRIFMLEKALAPENPAKVAAIFAKANKDRNGAVQFMLFSEQLKNKYKDYWPTWVSGTSSPWITAYTIKKMGQNKKSWQFQITYQWATSDGPFHPDLKQTITVEPVPENMNSSQKLWIVTFKED